MYRTPAAAAQDAARPAVDFASRVSATPNRQATADEEKALQARYPGYRKVAPDYRHAGQDALDRWMDWKWGLRIHWGLYSI